ARLPHDLAHRLAADLDHTPADVERAHPAQHDVLLGCGCGGHACCQHSDRHHDRIHFLPPSTSRSSPRKRDPRSMGRATAQTIIHWMATRWVSQELNPSYAIVTNPRCCWKRTRAVPHRFLLVSCVGSRPPTAHACGTSQPR